MFSRIRGFISRHRRKFIVSGVVLGSLILASRYAQRKFREWQEREAREFLERTRRQQHFESTERTCNQTIFSLAPKLIEAISKAVDTEELVCQLRSGHPNKRSIWDELKVLAFTKASVVVYAFAMLVVMLRVQLNLIGGYMFCQLNENDEGSNISSAVQEKYLSVVHYFLSNGIKELVTLVQNKVQYIMGGIPLKRRLNLNDTEQLFWALQAAIGSDDKDPGKNLSHYVLASDASATTSSNDEEDKILNTMIIETMDMLESEEVTSLLSSLVSQGFSNIVDRVSEYFIPDEVSKAALNAPSGSKQSNSVNFDAVAKIETQSSKDFKNGHVNGIGTFIHPNSIDMAMAKLIPIVNGLGHSCGQSTPDPWLQQLVLDDRIKMLGANVYEAFGHK